MEMNAKRTEKMFFTKNRAAARWILLMTRRPSSHHALHGGKVGLQQDQLGYLAGGLGCRRPCDAASPPAGPERR